MGDVTVGLVVNGASGHDIRRLVSAATVVDNVEKGAMTVRLLAGLKASGVDRVLAMPTDLAIASTVRRLTRAMSLEHGESFPTLEWLPLEPRFTASDTVQALTMLVEAGAAAVCVLGGDGTQRLTVGVLGDIPLAAVSTGTNNVFPHWAEPTMAGLAAGLVATGVVPVEVGCVREHALVAECAGRRAAALVDVGVSTAPWVGARAIWRVDDLVEVAAVFADPSAIGLSAIAAAVADAPRGRAWGAIVHLAPPAQAPHVVAVPIAPGVIRPVGVVEVVPIRFGETVTLASAVGTLTIDGERELPRPPGSRATVTFTDGPLRIDVAATLAAASRLGRPATSLQRPHA